MSWLPQRLVIEEEDLGLSIGGAGQRLACVILLLPKHKTSVRMRILLSVICILRKDKSYGYKVYKRGQ
jgi:hypothetical protein